MRSLIYIERDKLFDIENLVAQPKELDLISLDGDDAKKLLISYVDSLVLKATKINFESVSLFVVEEEIENKDFCLINYASQSFVKKVIDAQGKQEKNCAVSRVSYSYKDIDEIETFAFMISRMEDAVYFHDLINNKIDDLNSKFTIQPKLQHLYCNVSGNKEFVSSFISSK
ncbi:hypothetical protein [Photobacterium leiognathi]|uniref:hypothetical protein n=1 Tax=Photobacterium leiognathi TaxID=553611 RepID=UPI00298230BB|nr:hypothetical protein [Photobacterium leiognathi]